MSEANRLKYAKAAKLARAAKAKREGKICQVEHCGISVYGHLASGKQPRFIKDHGKTYAGEKAQTSAELFSFKRIGFANHLK
jgi:hypothetical protein